MSDSASMISHLKQIEAWIALEGAISQGMDSELPIWALPLIVTWIEVPLVGLSKRLLLIVVAWVDRERLFVILVLSIEFSIECC